MTLEVALALLAFSAPITAGIFVFRPSKRVNGSYVTTREYDTFKTDLGDRLGRMEGKIDSVDKYIRSRI